MRKNQNTVETVENIESANVETIDNAEVIENVENVENADTDNTTDTDNETKSAKRGRPAKYGNTDEMSHDELKSVVLSDDPTFTQDVSLTFLAENYGVNVSMDDYRIITNGIVKARVAEHAKNARASRETVVVTSAMRQIKDLTSGMDAETLNRFLAAFMASQTAENAEQAEDN